MKSFTQVLVLAAATFMGLASAQAHRVQFAGGEGSTTALLFDAIVKQAGQVEGLLVENKEDGSIRIFRNDTNQAIDCLKTGAQVACEMVEKHGRPLADFNTYPVGDYMDIAGDLQSMAGLFTSALKEAAATDATIKAVQYSETGLRLERVDETLKLTCIFKTGASDVPAACNFKFL